VKNVKPVILLSGLLALAACDVPPVVTDFNGSSVAIQGADITYSPEFKARYDAEAQRICGRVGKTAEYASSQAMPNYLYSHLYLCL
jgi:hypothetical protein